MTRDELRTIITYAADKAECDPEQRARLLATADEIDKVVVGNFHAEVDGDSCGCPAALAGYFDPENDGWSPDAGNVVRFPSRFDASIPSSRTKLTSRGEEYVEVTD